MLPVRRRLLMALLVVLGGASGSGLMLYALGDNIDLFYVPGQLSGGEVAPGQRLREEGTVLPGSFGGLVMGWKCGLWWGMSRGGCRCIAGGGCRIFLPRGSSR